MGDQNDVKVKVNIKDVILERKMERKLRAEQKRLLDLQRIRDMRSSTGIQPLEQFPKEIWEKILDLLNPEDRGNFWHVHPLFRSLMESTRIDGILLPQILKIDRFWHYLKQKYNDPVVELRLVSKTLRNSYDRWLDDRVVKRIKETLADSSGLVMNFTYIFHENDGKQPQKNLLTSFVGGQNPGKCFLSRGLAIYIYGNEQEDDGTIPELKADITTLLETIGDQIWHFRLNVNQLRRIYLSFSDVYLMLQGWLCLMPHLKWLEVLIEPTPQMLEGERGTERLSIAFSALQKDPIPHLTHLKRLSLHSNYQREAIGTFRLIYEAVLKANRHVKIFDLTDGNGNPSELQFLPTKLTHFSSYNNEAVETFITSSLTNLEKIFPVVQYNWPLQEITLHLCPSPSSGIDSVVSVFQFLEHFPTLKLVHLRLEEGFRIGDTEKLGYPKLQNLEHLVVKILEPAIDYETNTNFFFSLQFLLQCKKLKRICWELYVFDDKKLRNNLRKHDDGTGQMVDFMAGLRNLYDSNIWDVFPFLETVYVEISKDCKYFGDCGHNYQRIDLGTMSVRKFLSKHGCSRDNYLAKCVMLVKY